MKSNLKFFLFLLIIIVLAFLGDTLALHFLNSDTATFQHSVIVLHLFFASFTLVNVLVLQKIKQINIDIVGNTFLLLSSVKMVLAYLLVKPTLNSNLAGASFEKWHFFSIFIFFLLLDTAVVVNLLNSKSVKKEG